MGFELVDFRQRGTRQRPMLQARIDRVGSAPGRGVTVADCALVSRALERWLDESALFGERYVLEVSSPGIERPVRWPEHWRQFRGERVHVKLPERGRVLATIVDVSADDVAVTLKIEGEAAAVTVPIGEARDATLVVDWNEKKQRS